MIFFSTVFTTVPAPRAEDTGSFREELILKVARNDMAALQEIYDATSSKLFGFALSIVKNRDDAEDALQNSYLKLIANACTYKPQGKPMAWLCTIVKRECLTKLRENGKATPGYDESRRDADLEPDDGMREISSAADRVVLQAALELLSDEERQAIMLHAVSGLKYREIAVVMDLPLATVISKCNRAFKKLRHYLEEKEATVK